MKLLVYVLTRNTGNFMSISALISAQGIYNFWSCDLPGKIQMCGLESNNVGFIHTSNFRDVPNAPQIYTITFMPPRIINMPAKADLP